MKFTPKIVILLILLLALIFTYLLPDMNMIWSSNFWVYNSIDKKPNIEESPTKENKIAHLLVANRKASQIKISRQVDPNDELETENSKRLDRLREKCLDYRKEQSVSIRQSHYNYVQKAIFVLNDDFSINMNTLRPKSKNSNPLITACIPPKTGTTNWQMLLYSIWKNTSMEGTEKIKKILKNDFFQSLPKLLGLQQKLISGYPNYSRISGEHIQTKLYLDALIEKIQLLKENGIKTTGTVINTRHPFARLISAWRSKFTKYSNGWKDPVSTSFHDDILTCIDYDKKYASS